MFRPQGQAVESDTVSRSLLNISQNIVVIVCGLFPILFIPAVYVPLSYSKTLFVLFGMVLALIFFSLYVLREGSLTLQVAGGMIALWLLALATAGSALLSGDIHDSFIGDTFGIHTAAFLGLLALVASMVHILRDSKTAIMRLYILLIVSASLLSVYHIARILFGADFLSLGVFSSSVATPLGGWNDLALYFGLVVLLILVAVEQLPLTKMGRILIGVVAAFSLVMLAVVNFFAVWLVLGFVSLIALMYSLTKNRFKDSQLSLDSEEKSSLSSILLSVSVFVVSLLFVVGGGGLGSMISNATGISYVEVRPSLSATFDVARNVYEKDPVLGIGPNKFIDAWRLYRDPSINQTLFWNTNFDSGSGYITTAFATNGIFVSILWLVFLGSILYTGGRMMVRSQRADRFWHFIGTSSLVSVVYFWGMSIFFTPTPSILVLAAICTGIFFTAASVLVPHRSFTFSVLQNRNLGFILIGVVMAVIFAAVSTLYFTSQHYVALHNFSKTLNTVTAGDQLEDIERSIASAYEKSNNDVFARQIAGYQLTQMNTLLGVSEPTEQQIQVFQTATANGINAAQLAVTIDPSEPLNHQIQGRLFSTLAATGIEGAEQRARESLQKAAALNPQNPLPQLLLAQLAFRTGDLEAARSSAEEAVALRSNYTEALNFLAELDISEGKVTEAISHTEAIISLEPNNPARYYQLGILESSNKNIPRAIVAFEQAIALNKDYANARYFLALAYVDQGRMEEALAQLEIIQSFNPDNQQLQSIIVELKNGGTLSTDSAVIEEPVAVSVDGEQVTTTQAPDTSLVSPVNTVPSPEVVEDTTNDPE